MNKFDFFPSNSTAGLKLALEYSPKIHINRICRRKSTGVVYILEGEYLYSFAESSIFAKAGDVVYLPSDAEPYEYKILSPDGVARVYQIEINLTDVKTGAPICFARHPVVIDKTECGDLKKMFETIIRNEKKSDLSSRLELYSAIYRILSVCAEGIDERETHIVNSKISPAVNYIKENYKSPIQTKTLAELCYVSESQLRRLFSAELGVSPIRYKNRILADEACRLLQNSELSISEISNILGFSDVYAFSHSFAKEKGISPRSYRSRHAEQKANN